MILTYKKPQHKSYNIRIHREHARQPSDATITLTHAVPSIGEA